MDRKWCIAGQLLFPERANCLIVGFVSLGILWSGLDTHDDAYDLFL